MIKYPFLLFLYCSLINTMENSNQFLECPNHKNKTKKNIKLNPGKYEGIEIIVTNNFASLETLMLCQKITENHLKEEHLNKNLVYAFYKNDKPLFHCDIDKWELCCEK